MVTATKRWTACARRSLGGLLCLASAACGESTSAPAPALALDAPGDSLLVWRAMQVAFPAGMTTGRIVWTVSDSSIAAIDSNGTVTALAEGRVTVSGTRGDVAAKHHLVTFLRPVAVGSVVRSAAAHYYQLCVLTDAGRALCNDGAPTADSMPRFTPRPGGADLALVSLSAPFASPCGMDANGRAYCWGANTHGHFGLGPSGVPVGVVDTGPVPGAGAMRFKRYVAGGHAHACGIQQSDDVLYCWGHNDFGQTGQSLERADRRTPAPVSGGLRARDMSLSNFRTCALALDGQPWCWGLSMAVGIEGQTLVLPTRIAGSPPLQQLSLAEDHACGTTATGDVWCWGENKRPGFLGTANAQAGYAAPARILGSVSFRKVVARYREGACGISSGNDLYCWPAASGVAGPLRITRTGDVEDIALNLTRVCIVTRNGGLRCN